MAMKTFTYTETVTHTLTVEVPDDFKIDEGYSAIPTFIDSYLGMTQDPGDCTSDVESADAWDADAPSETPDTRILPVEAQKAIARRLVGRLPEDVWEDELCSELEAAGARLSGSEQAVFVLDTAMNTQARSDLFRRYAVNLVLWDAEGRDENDGDTPAHEFLGEITGHTGDDWYIIPGVVVCHDYGEDASENFPTLTSVLKSAREGRELGTDLVINPGEHY